MSKKKSHYKPTTKKEPELREDIIKQNKEKYNKLLYHLTNDGILLSELKEAMSWKLGGSDNPKIGCVYKITNIINNKIYIGSTTNFIIRLHDHIRKLNNNTHHSSHLQNAWNKYGDKNFIIVLIELIPYDDKKYNNNKEYITYLRQREQYYLDKYKSYDRKIGYNICNVADTVHVDTEKLFEDEKLKYSKQFIIEICELMMDTKYNLREIAEMKNVKFSLVKDINQYRAYKDITEKYNFPVRNNKTLWSVFEDKKEDIYKLYYEGKTEKEIAEIMNLKERDVNHLFSFSTIPKPIYIYSIKQELIKVFYMPQTAAKYLGTTAQTLAHTLINSDRNNGVAFLQNRFDIIISRKSNPPEFSSIEKYLGQYINPTFKPIFKYDEYYEEIIEIYVNSYSVPNYKQSSINAYCAKRKHGWSNYKSTPQKDIDNFLIKKGFLTI